MKKVNRFFCTLFLVSIVLSSFVIASNDSKSSKIDITAEKTRLEENYKSDDKWQVSDELLKGSTMDLALGVITNPQMSRIIAWSDARTGFEYVLKDFTGLQELINRDDAGTVLVEIFCHMPVTVSEKDMASYFPLMNIEILLNQKEVYSKLSSNQIRVAQEKALENAFERGKGDFKLDMYIVSSAEQSTPLVLTSLLEDKSVEYIEQLNGIQIYTPTTATGIDAALMEIETGIIDSNVLSSTSSEMTFGPYYTHNGLEYYYKRKPDLSVSDVSRLNTEAYNNWGLNHISGYPASARYNCHYYSYFTLRNYWMNTMVHTQDPYHCQYRGTVEVTAGRNFSIAQSNDIVFYRDHSGRVSSASSSAIYVRAKWGTYGEYLHKLGDPDPYFVAGRENLSVMIYKHLRYS